MTAATLGAAAVRVPGSTSNLGSGFDTVGLALDRYLDARFRPDDSGTLTVERHGTLRRLDEFPGPDITAATFRRTVEQYGRAPSGSLRIESSIPVIRGFGSSAAALVAGHDLARAALGLDMSREESFRAGVAREGHGDNAGPSTFGGLCAVVPDEDGPRVVRLRLSPSLGFAYAAPARPLATSEARAALPPTVGHATAIGALGRLAALLEGLATGDPALIAAGIQDELHVPYRLPLIEGGAEAVAAGYEAGAWGVTISGGGSGLIAVCSPETAEGVASAMRAVFDSGRDDPECVGFVVSPDVQGLRRM
jgi:homoserine kinase